MMTYRMGVVMVAVLAAVLMGSLCQAGLVRHYPLDTINAGTTPDSTGNADGTLSGTAPVLNAAGVIGSALEFTDKSAEYVEFADPFFGDGSVTLSYWAKRNTSTNNDGTVGNWQGGRTILSRINGSTLQVYARNGADQSTGTTGLTLSDTTSFHHVAVTYDGQTVRTFLDGVAGNAQGFVHPSLGEAASGTMAIGGRGNSEWAMNGLVDDVALFDETLSPAKIKAISGFGSSLGYNASEALPLLATLDTPASSVTVGTETWITAPDGSMPGTAGDVVPLADGGFGLVLNDVGGGMATKAITPTQTYKIDIDTTDGAGGPLATEQGWYSLDATGTSNNATLTVNGITFSPFSADASRVRRTNGVVSPNNLTGDFIYDDGGAQAVGVSFGGPGDLIEGWWDVEVWSWDDDYPVLGDQILALRTDGAETIFDTNVVAHPTDPVGSFRFYSDGIAAYDFFLRENDTVAGIRTRLNAFTLTHVIPEPSSFILSAIALVGVGLFVRRRRRGAPPEHC